MYNKGVIVGGGGMAWICAFEVLVLKVAKDS